MTALPPTRGYETVPRYSLIENITLGQLTVINFTADHDFVLGQNIGIRVPYQYGTVELNNKEGHILALTSDSITVDIDSSNFTPFNSVSNPIAIAMVVPSTSGILPGSNPATVILNDAYSCVRT
jgi:hypothetical protein